MKFLKYLTVFLIVISCSTPQVVYDYDPKVNFTALNTYQIYPDLVTNLNQLDEKRLITILEEKMADKGFTRASQTPDLFINFYSSDYQTPNRNSVGVGVGGTGRNVGVGISGGIPLGGPNTYKKITFDFIDAANDALIWQAIVEAEFDLETTPEKRAERLSDMVEKALEGYPPKK